MLGLVAMLQALDHIPLLIPKYKDKHLLLDTYCGGSQEADKEFNAYNSGNAGMQS